VGGGAAGMTYGLSVLAVSEPLQRRKIIDLLFCIGTPMVDLQLPVPPPPPPFQYVKTHTDLPVGTVGSIYIQNETGEVLVLGLPQMPNVDDDLNIKDIIGNAAEHNILIHTLDGSRIDQEGFYVLAWGYGALHIKWTGAKWSIMP